MPTLFQAGTLPGILHGIYEGDVDFKTLLQHGDIGLGLLNGGDGEMLAIDGNFYRIAEQGKAEEIDPMPTHLSVSLQNPNPPLFHPG